MIAPSGMAHPTGVALLTAFPLCYVVPITSREEQQ
jgi:hypothetical protein